MAALALAEDIVYTVPDDVRILDFLGAPCWMTDYSPDDTRFVWANTAGLQTWGKKDLENLKATDIRYLSARAKSLVSSVVYPYLRVEDAIIQLTKAMENRGQTSAVKATQSHLHGKVQVPSTSPANSLFSHILLARRWD